GPCQYFYLPFDSREAGIDIPCKLRLTACSQNRNGSGKVHTYGPTQFEVSKECRSLSGPHFHFPVLRPGDTTFPKRNAAGSGKGRQVRCV
ncbi:hypothetical protein M5D96_012011, partial [Drosophila gunungcola]